MQRPTPLRPRVVVADNRSLEATPASVRAVIAEMRGALEHVWNDDGLEWWVASVGPSSWPLFVVTSFVREHDAPPPSRLTSSPFPMWTFHRTTFRFVSMNEPAAHLHGGNGESLVGKRVVDFMAWADAFDLVRLAADLAPNGVTHARLSIRRADGTSARVDAQLVATEHDGKPACTVLTTRENE